MTYDQARIIIAKLRGTSRPIVAWTTPTLGRPETHPTLYAMFKRQTYSPLLMFVYDESTEPSPFFLNLQDPSVTYVHAPMSYKREVTRIGAARNALCRMARATGAEFIVSADDDDHYVDRWTEVMVEKLGDADVAKLAVFRLLMTKGEAAGTLWLWDVRTMGGVHYGLKGDEAPQKTEIGQDEDPMYATAVRYGFAFSWIWRSELSERIPFPEEGTEDYPWLRQCMDAGARVVEVDDYSEGCIHVVGTSQSMHFPQTPLSPGFSGPRPSLRDFVRWRMLGAVSAMHELPVGQDIHAKPGATYQVLSAIKSNHTLKSVVVRAQSWGLTVTASRDNVDPSEFGVAASAKGYRLVHVVGTTSKPIVVPWQGNKLIRKFDASSIVRAWSDEPVRAQVNPQLQPAAGVAGLHGFGGGRCDRCVNYAWIPEMGPSMKAVDGSMHHPSCDALAGLAPTKMERMTQRLHHRRPDLGAGVVRSTLGPRGRAAQINGQLEPR